jgi:hypothetical protein
MTTRIEMNDIDHVITVNGIKMSYELINALTATTPEGVYLRIEREGDTITVAEYQFEFIPAEPNKWAMQDDRIKQFFGRIFRRR